MSVVKIVGLGAEHKQDYVKNQNTVDLNVSAIKLEVKPVMSSLVQVLIKNNSIVLQLQCLNGM